MKPWWQVLGVPRGSDRATIRRAYAARLKTTNPEDDAKGFMALREAYEAALRWVEYDYGWDEDETGGEEGSAEAEDAAAPPIVEAAAVGIDPEPDAPEPAPPETEDEPVFVPLPREAPVSPVPDDPAEAARRADAAELERLKAALDAGLRGPWYKDKPGLIAAFDALMAAPALMEIDRRDRVEHWLASLIANTIPRSDAILKEAMAAFGWEAEGNHPPAVGQIRERLDEWRLIARFQRDDHPLNAGWRALTRGDVAAWRRRIGALRPGVADQVRELFDLTEYDLTGIVHSFEPRAADWWRAHLGQSRFGSGELTLIALGALGALIFALVGATPALRIGGALAAGAAGIGLALLNWRVVAPTRWRRGEMSDGAERGFGWRLGLWLTTVAIFIGVPMTPWIAGGAILVAVTSAIAILLFDSGGRDGGAVSWKRTIALGILAALGAAGFVAMTASEQAALLAFGASCGLIGMSARFAIARLIALRPILFALGGVLLLLGGAWIRSAMGASGSPLLPWFAAGSTGLLLMSALRTRDPQGREGAVADLVGWGLWVVLVIAALMAAPNRARDALPPPIRVESLTPMEALEKREPGFRLLKTGNPELYAQVEAIREAMAAGKRDRVGSDAEIDRLVNAAYRERLPRARASLIAAEMDIRLAQLRDFQSATRFGACSGIDRPEGKTVGSSDLARRHYAHALRVAASEPAPASDLAAGREIQADVLVQRAAGGDAAEADRLSRAMRGSDARAKCAARIAILEALVAHEDADIAKTMRPALTARATPDSTKK